MRPTDAVFQTKVLATHLDRTQLNVCSVKAAHMTPAWQRASPLLTTHDDRERTEAGHFPSRSISFFLEVPWKHFF